MPTDELNRRLRRPCDRGAQWLPVQPANAIDRLCAAGEFRGHQDSAIVAQRPCSGIEQFVHRRFDGEAVVDRVRSFARVPLDVRGLAAEILPLEGCPEACHCAPMLVCAEDVLAEPGIPGDAIDRILSRFSDLADQWHPEPDGIQNVLMQALLEVTFQDGGDDRAQERGIGFEQRRETVLQVPRRCSERRHLREAAVLTRETVGALDIPQAVTSQVPVWELGLVPGRDRGCIGVQQRIQRAFHLGKRDVALAVLEP